MREVVIGVLWLLFLSCSSCFVDIDEYRPHMPVSDARTDAAVEDARVPREFVFASLGNLGPTFIDAPVLVETITPPPAHGVLLGSKGLKRYAYNQASLAEETPELFVGYLPAWVSAVPLDLDSSKDLLFANRTNVYCCLSSECLSGQLGIVWSSGSDTIGHFSFSVANSYFLMMVGTHDTTGTKQLRLFLSTLTPGTKPQISNQATAALANVEQPGSLAVDDYDKDGRPDAALLYPRQQGNRFSHYLSAGDGLGVHIFHIDDLAADTSIAGTFDGDNDGRLDVAIFGKTNPMLTMARNPVRPPWTLQPAQAIPGITGMQIIDARLASIEGSGRQALLALVDDRLGTNSSVHLLVYQITANRGSLPLLNGPYKSVSPTRQQWAFSGQSPPLRLVTGDVDGDGLTDVLVVNDHEVVALRSVP